MTECNYPNCSELGTYGINDMRLCNNHKRWKPIETAQGVAGVTELLNDFLTDEGKSNLKLPDVRNDITYGDFTNYMSVQNHIPKIVWVVTRDIDNGRNGSHTTPIKVYQSEKAAKLYCDHMNAVSDNDDLYEYEKLPVED